MRFNTIQTILFTLLVSTSMTASAEIYEWLDENGVKQYSQTPPSDAESQAYEPSDAGTLSVSGNENKAVSATASEQQAETEEESIARVKEELAKEKERMQLNCEVAQHNLKILSAVGTGKFKDEDGNVIQLTAEDQTARKAEAQQQIDTNCNK